jgi:Transferase family
MSPHITDDESLLSLRKKTIIAVLENPWRRMTKTNHELVRPTTSPTATPSWPLTPIDQFALQWLIQGTWVFDVNVDANALKHGLARLLDAYPILCGRVAAGKSIEWTETGVPVIEETDASLGVRDFGPTRTDVTRFGYRHSPTLIRRGRAPLMTVKLTRLRDGCVLAICCSHACLDGNGFYSMARNLSRATAGKPFSRPVFDRPPTRSKLRSRAEVARDAQQTAWHRFTMLDTVRYALARPRLLDRSFVAHFSPSTLQRCKDELVRGSGCDRLSTNSALLAHVAHCVVTLLGLDANSSFALSAAVDQRGRVAALADDFAGNAVSVAATSPIPARASPADIAVRLHKRLEPILGRPSPELESIARLTAEVVGHRLPYSTIPVSGMLGRRPKLFYTNSFSKFPVYDVDFGEASRPVRPVRAIPHNLGDPIVLWPAPPSAGGVELYFSGTLARAVERLGKDDQWWAELHSFDDEKADRREFP